ncbi:hypothetical protein CF327_g4714 [Tilletia walkeri]|nr:hypothetical protein CF327_g4714 [Tilletia walkeri]
MHQKKKIVLLLDGTWASRTQALMQCFRSRSGEERLSNVGVAGSVLAVALLAQAIKTENADGIPQICFYQEGVGTSVGLLTNIISGATGAGLSQNLIEAYSFIVDNYNPGDELFLIGFSRGAYTARALSGFILWAGIMSKAALRHIQPIYQAYRKRSPSKPEDTDLAAQVLWRYTGIWPSAESMRVEQLVVEQHAVTAAARAATSAWGSKLGLSSGGKGEGPDPGGARRQLRASTSTLEVELEEQVERGPRAQPPNVKFLGVMDTVGALGVPGKFGTRWARQFYEFFDTGLSSNVEYAWQALALGEERADFSPTLWYHFEPHNGQELSEIWFGGSHANVGGTLAHHGLSDIVLACLCAHLTDRGERPMLELDIEHVKNTQDRSAAWAKEEPYKSRWFFEFRKIRQVCGMLKTGPSGENGDEDNGSAKEPRWADEIPYGPNKEMLHHSIVMSGRIDPATAPQFQVLRQRDPERLGKMWDSAANASSLLPTECYLRW